MKQSRPAYGLTGAFLEMLHDEGISMMYEGTEPVGRGECLSLNLRDSAPVAPFQSVGGVDAYPTIFDKAACLFFSVVCGHIFTNGNKRTAVLALDIFLLANDWYLYFSEQEIVELARRTASYRIEGRTPDEVKNWLSEQIEQHCASFDAIAEDRPEMIGRLRASLDESRKSFITYS